MNDVDPELAAMAMASAEAEAGIEPQEPEQPQEPAEDTVPSYEEQAAAYVEAIWAIPVEDLDQHIANLRADNQTRVIKLSRGTPPIQMNPLDIIMLRLEAVIKVAFEPEVGKRVEYAFESAVNGKLEEGEREQRLALLTSGLSGPGMPQSAKFGPRDLRRTGRG